MLGSAPQTFAFVQYHVSDAYERPWGSARANFYGVSGIPDAWFDGMTECIGGHPYGDYLAEYNRRRSASTDVTLKLSGQLQGGQNCHVSAKIGLTAGQSESVRLYIVQVLDHWPPGASYHRNGFKQAAGTQDLSLTAGNDQTVEVDFTLDAESAARPNDVRIIAWAQQPKGSAPAEVYQAAILGFSAGSQDTGTLQVDTTPVKGEVFVGGESWGTAPQSRELATGTYTVSFSALAGYTTPDDQQVAVQKGATVRVMGTYVPIGSMMVDTTPVKGEVVVDGEDWGKAPQGRQVPAGVHTVSFGQVAGYEKPADQHPRVEIGHTAQVTATYLVMGGTVSVDTVPVRGLVFVDGVYWGTAPTSGRAAPGDHTVSFGTVRDYAEPDPQQISLQLDQTIHVTGVYQPLAGTLQVDTLPVKGEVLVDGVNWGPAPQSGQLSVGEHAVSYGVVAGYTQPAGRSAMIFKDQVTKVVETYLAASGMLAVDTTPVRGEVFVDGVSWGLAPLTRSVVIGQHNVSFGAVAGYQEPAAQEVSVSLDRTAQVSGVYVAVAAILSVDTNPVKGEVFVDGVSWGTAPQHGQLAAGSHTISFGAVAGYTPPTDQQVQLEKGENPTITGEYLPIGASLQAPCFLVVTMAALPLVFVWRIVRAAGARARRR